MMRCNFGFLIICSLTILLVFQRLTAAYAEIHFAFKKGLSFIYRKRPEIIGDAPWRVKRGGKLPLLWVVKDSHLFPIKMLRVEAVVSQGSRRYRAVLFEGGEELRERAIFRLAKLRLPQDIVGRARVDLLFTYESGGLVRRVKNDNLPGLSHDGFELYVSDDPLPALEGWYYGDVHYHSDKTDDQVEFGAPVWAAVEMAKAIGLSWFAVTDHSYDLDIPPGEVLGLDRSLSRWRELVREVEEINGREEGFAVLLGEEISCGNHADQNVHLLAFRSRQFIPGRGDGAKRRFILKNHPDLSLKEVLARLGETGGYGYAAHPHEGSTFLSRLVLNRGHWSDEDLTERGCYGMQLWNGCSKIGLEISYRHWVKLLLSGRRMFIVAGSDAHGDFNRFRRVSYPFLWVSERRGGSFGRPRTCVHLPEGVSEEAVHEALRSGRCVVTDGPFGAIFAEAGGRRVTSGGELPAGRIKVEAVCLSTPEFGRVKQAKLIVGDLRRRREIVFSKLRISAFEERFSCNIAVSHPIYLRMEVISEKGRCLTNPIWVG
ncbi:hypothetical protein DRP77_05640 [Candidatus Poribacteria bacterium]|nr:MAG: hypothetical protein DRP77_05640 [Candidatus Poribacteria bacterium]